MWRKGEEVEGKDTRKPYIDSLPPFSWTSRLSASHRPGQTVIQGRILDGSLGPAPVFSDSACLPRNVYFLKVP